MHGNTVWNSSGELGRPRLSIVDFRVRPPVPSVLGSFLYSNPSDMARRAGARGFKPPRTVESRRIEDVVHDMDDSLVRLGIVPCRLGSPGMGNLMNEDAVKLHDQYPSRFVGFAAPDPLDIETFANGLMQLRQANFFRGVNLEPGTWGTPLYVDSVELDPVYEVCQSISMPVMLMTGGSAGPDLSYNDPIRVERVIRKYPNLRVIISHGGWPEVQNTLGIAYLHKNVYVSPDTFIYGMSGWRDYVEAANSFLQDRMLFGTAYPILPMVDCVKFARDHLNPVVHDKFFFKNALDVIGLESM